MRKPPDTEKMSVSGGYIFARKSSERGKAEKGHLEGAGFLNETNATK